MGDNRDNSLDSRKTSAIGVGFIPYENLVGRASLIFWSTNGNASLFQVWKWANGTRGDRIFTDLAPE